MKIEISKENKKDWKVSPSTEELRAALTAITRWYSLDGVVTFALRRTGYGGDSFGITYPDDLDDHDKLEFDIPAGYVEVSSCGETPLLLEEKTYLRLLVEVCKYAGLIDRVLLLENFIHDPKISRNLVEADGYLCKKRWQDFVPFLIRRAWTLEQGMIVSPSGSMKFNATSYSNDLCVLYRDSIQKINGADNQNSTDYESLVNAIDEYFDSSARNRI